MPPAIKKLIADVKAATDDYFRKYFTENKLFDPKSIFLLKMWTDFTVRLTDDAETLREKYFDTFADGLTL